jgi:hypothetical protein
VWNERTKKWYVRIVYKNERFYGGIYSSLKNAAAKYNELAKKLFGDDAVLNDISLIEE